MNVPYVNDSKIFIAAKNRLVRGDFHLDFIPTHYTDEQAQNHQNFWKIRQRLTFLRENLVRAASRDNARKISVTPDDVYKIGEAQNWKDPFTGEDLEFVRGGNWGMKNAFGTGASNPKSCSIDRINSDEDYVLGNIQLVTALTNLAKGNMTNQEFINYCKMVSSHNS